ncbi:MAG: helix-turn-helix domain-containing protein [Clostridiales bacterium]|nr:helix-turn-helix domain-containing protein [Clostridiales bacterium]
MYQEVMRNNQLSPEAKAIYAYLSSIAGSGDSCYPSVETMQKELCMSKNRLMKHMGQLIAFGVVEKARERNGNIYGRNIYKITHEVESANDLKRIFEAVENEAVEIRAVENEAVNNNNTNNNTLNNNSIGVCPEPESSVSGYSDILLPLIDKSEYNVPLPKIEQWQQAYPAVDVRQELLRMISWLNANPKRKKTKRGVDRFITTWLSKEQDRGGTYRTGTRSGWREGGSAANHEVEQRAGYGQY